jgi:hypothetical protein
MLTLHLQPTGLAETLNWTRKRLADARSRLIALGHLEPVLGPRLLILGYRRVQRRGCLIRCGRACFGVR